MQINGSKGQTLLMGSAEDDGFWLYSGKGTQVIDGGAGTDTLRIEHDFGAYRLERNSAGEVLLSVGNERIILRNIEQLQNGEQVVPLEQALLQQQGTAGNDSVQLFGHQTQYDAGAGVDTVRLAGSVASGGFQFEHDPASGRWTVQTSTQTLQLDGVEVLQFDDLRVDLRESGAILLQPTRLWQPGADRDLLGNDFGQSLWGGEGNNHFEGRGGDDFLWGGPGEDTAVFRGKLSDYVIQLDLRTGMADVMDKMAGRDGKDWLFHVDKLQFSDGLFDIKDVAQIVEPELVGYEVFEAAPDPLDALLPDIPLIGVADHGVEGAGDFQLPL